MSSQAHVESVAALEAFRAALAAFESRMQGALDSLSAEVRRADGWLDFEAPPYWKEQEKKAHDAVHQARLELERCLMFPVADEKPTCREERANLKRAEQRLDYCREKKALVRHWQSELNHEMYEFDGRIGHLKRVLETDLPAARAKIQQIIRTIEGYQIERAPGSAETVRSTVATPRGEGRAESRPTPAEEEPSTESETN